MKIYIVIVNDRHVDIAAYAFSDKEKAISEASKIAKEYCRHARYYDEYYCDPEEKEVFYAKYSTEGDAVCVIQATLDEEIEI